VARWCRQQAESELRVDERLTPTDQPDDRGKLKPAKGFAAVAMTPATRMARGLRPHGTRVTHTPTSADVPALVGRHRLRLQLPASQQRVPEGIIGLMHNHALEAPEQQLTLARVCHGNVCDLFR
jgi:hypothetical protein